MTEEKPHFRDEDDALLDGVSREAPLHRGGVQSSLGPGPLNAVIVNAIPFARDRREKTTRKVHIRVAMRCRSDTL